jgi:NAD(P)-dependent dehydrogenase (short-subunit alcohol dehydrogenase family)
MSVTQEEAAMEVRNEGVFIVTGGLGALAGGVAEVFKAAGARLALADREGSAVRARAAALDAAAITVDLTSPGEAQRMVSETKEAFGRVDGLIHTAGGFAAAPADQSTVELYDRMFDVNMRTLFNATSAVLPSLLAQENGFLAGISTNLVWSGSGGAGMALYAASKAALTFYLRSIEREVRAWGVRVAIVYPLSPIDTPANRRDMPSADPAAWVDATEIGQALLFASTRGPRGRLVELPLGVAR